MLPPPGMLNCDFPGTPRVPSAEQLMFCKELAPNLDFLWWLFTEKVLPVTAYMEEEEEGGRVSSLNLRPTLGP